MLRHVQHVVDRTIILLGSKTDSFGLNKKHCLIHLVVKTFVRWATANCGFKTTWRIKRHPDFLLKVENFWKPFFIFGGGWGGGGGPFFFFFFLFFFFLFFGFYFHLKWLKVLSYRRTSSMLLQIFISGIFASFVIPILFF